MKLVSWNVNGLRAVLGKGFLDFVAAADADVLCLQETRALPEQVALAVPGYQAFWNPAEKKGYSGTMFLSRLPLEEVRQGLGVPELDGEGRVLTARVGGVQLVNVYTPNSQRGLTRLDFRTQQWDPAFRTFLHGLQAHGPVVFCGDLNVAHQEIDIANPAANRRNAGFTDEERGTFDRLLAEDGFVDTFRVFCQEGGHYTWWSNFGRARERNIGWRIDYFCVSAALRPRLVAAEIHPTVLGSDHCPISLQLA
ncbi:MAG: exodeoxyribonuclease III [Myxococcota bacterium]|jgi:exodeoxyribonuclease-3|nr:exodeoxyribonuclease III [Myxococcota bacterium]